MEQDQNILLTLLSQALYHNHVNIQDLEVILVWIIHLMKYLY